jgi:ribosomal protein S18 acetylase RimI-like enzyme
MNTRMRPGRSGAGITFRRGNDLDLDAVVELYRASTLAARRPVHDREAMAQMIAHANLVITAWDDALLVGIARSLTDFAYVAYLSDLAVRETYQHRGIGRALVRETRSALAPRARIVLLAAPAAQAYYPKLGFTHHPQAWVLAPHEALDGGE